MGLGSGPFVSISLLCGVWFSLAVEEHLQYLCCTLSCDSQPGMQITHWSLVVICKAVLIVLLGIGNNLCPTWPKCWFLSQVNLGNYILKILKSKSSELRFFVAWSCLFTLHYWAPWRGSIYLIEENTLRV